MLLSSPWLKVWHSERPEQHPLKCALCRPPQPLSFLANNKSQQKVGERGWGIWMKSILLHSWKAKSHLQMTSIRMRVGWGLRHSLVFTGLVSTLSFGRKLFCSPPPYRLRKTHYLSHLFRLTVISSKICFILWAQSHTMDPLGWLVPLDML